MRSAKTLFENCRRITLVVIMQVAFVLPVSFAQSISEFEAERDSLNAKIKSCEQDLNYLEERILGIVPNAQNADGSWKDVDDLFDSGDQYDLYWTISQYKDLVAYDEEVNLCIKTARSKLNELKKELNTALKTSVVEEENTSDRAGLPRKALLDIKQSTLDVQAVINHLFNTAKEHRPILDFIGKHAESE